MKKRTEKDGMTYKETQETYILNVFGFPVVLHDVDILEDANGDHTYPDINFEKLRKKVLRILANTNTALTGAHVAFIRRSMGLNLREFAQLVGVNHPTVTKWEARGTEQTRMNYGTEVVIKMHVLKHLKAKKSITEAFNHLPLGNFSEANNQLEIQ